jgi:hypothetical protein
MTLDKTITASLIRQSPKIARVQVQKQGKAAFQKIKNKMIVEFLNHPVTRELKQGIDASNVSGTLGGITNLFSFIGFDSNSDPTKSIEDILQQTRFEYAKARPTTIEFSIYIPDPKDVFAVTPMPWAAGRSWAKGIESGISGLGYYLKVERDNSRSGLGIQSSRKVRKGGVKFKNTQYISALLKKYKKEFENLQLA